MKEYLNLKRLLLIILISTTAYGANEIRAYYESGNTLYAVIRDGSGQAFDTTGNAFEAWNTMSDYDISLADQSGGLYTGTFDADASAGEYTIMIYKQVGGSVDDSDPPIMFEEGYWDGTYWNSTTGRLEDIHTDTGTTIPGTITTLTGYATNIMADSNAIFTDTDSTIPGTLTTMTGYLTNIMADSNDTITYWTAWDSNFTQVVNDTNELMGDWEDGGRLDLILDAGGGGGASAADIADAVWDEVMSGHTGATTFGGELQELDPNVTLLSTSLADLKIAMDANFAAIDFDTTGIDANFVALKAAMDANFAALNDPNVEEIRAEIDANSTQLAAIKAYTDLLVIVSTTVADDDDANSCTLTAGLDANDIYNGCIVMVQDADDSHYELAIISDWTSARVITFEHTLGFTPAVDDKVYIMGTTYFGLNWWLVETLNRTIHYFDYTPPAKINVYDYTSRD